MIKFERYPHVKDMIEYYAKKSGNQRIIDLLQSDINSKEEAFVFARFIITMIDAMHEDEDNGVKVLGATKYINMIPDIDYEVSAYLDDRYDGVWDQVCDE